MRPVPGPPGRPQVQGQDREEEEHPDPDQQEAVHLYHLCRAQLLQERDLELTQAQGQ